MKRKICLITFLIVSLIINLACARCEEKPKDNTIDFEAQGFQKLSATAYCMGHHTANGSPVHPGGCASSREHLGDVAIIYTIDGNFLGYYECNDLGGTEGIQNGYVIDLYRSNLTQCQSFMKLIAANDYKVWVKYIEGEG